MSENDRTESHLIQSPDDSRPRVSFVVTSYNYGRYVRQALDSLLNQTLRALEVIVVDDASTDDTPLIIEEYRSEPRVRIVKHAVNIGHIASYNQGLALATGHFIGILSADDFLLRQDAVARQVEMFESDSAVGLVYSAHSIFEDGVLVRHVVPWPNDGVRSGLDEFRSLIWGNYILHSGTLLRSEVARSIGLYDARLPHAGDWDLWLRAAARCAVAYIAEPLYGYRLHHSNMFHNALPPSRETDQVLVTIDRAFAALARDAPQDIRAIRPAVERHGLLQTPWFDLYNGRRKRTWQGLAYAVRKQPALATSGEFWRFMPRLLIMTVGGRWPYRRLVGWLEGRRKQAPVQRIGAAS